MEMELNLDAFEGNESLLRKKNTVSHETTIVSNLNQKDPVIFNNLKDELGELIEKVKIILDENGKVKLMVSLTPKGVEKKIKVDWYDNGKEEKGISFFF
ncbi:MAG: hypothetical protein NT052_01415 [Candidatus Shapirobacteria bacterium]|nr:hypothetical protein [Candidatus Shapirobacteria bacterium]